MVNKNKYNNGYFCDAISQLSKWVQDQNFIGWDPFDALNSPFIKRLTFSKRRLGQIWVQLFKHSPINLRPLFGVKKGPNPKGMGLFLSSYWRKYLLNQNVDDFNYVDFFAEWLLHNVSSGYHGYCWGYNFDWPNRGFFAPSGTPTIVNTAFIGLSFLDLISSSDVRKSFAFDPLAVSRSACEFVLEDLNRYQPYEDEICFSYTPLDQRYVHNANVMGAWLLAEVGLQAGELGLLTIAQKAARYTARRQNVDGSWFYGEKQFDHWIDNFHTGYVLVALKRIGECLDTNEFDSSLYRGYQFWKNNFFTENFEPKFYPEKTYPIDIHSISQAILTFLAFRDVDNVSAINAEKVACWAIDHMQSPAGYFYYQKKHMYDIRIPYMRWSQAWMHKALIELQRDCGPL